MKFILLFILIFGTIFGAYEDDECESRSASDCYPEGCRYNVNTSKPECIKCVYDFHCFDNPKYVCGEDGKCRMKSISNLELNVKWYEILSFFVCFLIVVISTIGGVGGGIILVSSLLAIGQFHIKSISPMSSSLVFGASLCAVLMTLMKKHPSANRPIIDWDFVTTVEPIVLSGTLVGVILNSVFPSWLTLLILLVVICFSLYKVSEKGIKLYRQENKERKGKEEGNEETKEEEEKESELESLEEDTDSDLFSESSEGVNEGGKEVEEELLITSTQEEEEEEIDDFEEHPLLENILWYESIQLPVHKMMVLLFSWLVILTVSLLKGSKRVSSIAGFEACSISWWMIMIIAFPILFLTSYIYAFIMNRKHNNKVKSGYEYLPDDMRWDVKKSIFVPIIFIVSGVVAALIGTGGGLINGPLMISMGYNPQVMTSTNLLMIFITSSSGFTQFMVAQNIPIDYALVMIVIGFVAAFVGRSSASMIVKKTGRRSVIVIILASLIVAAGFASLGVGIYKIILGYKTGQNMWFKSPC